MRHHATKQNRSEETFERIIASANAMYVKHRTVDVPVREICEHAGASRSSFYARFPDASSLTHTCYEQFCEQVRSHCASVDLDWAANHPGSTDFETFVSFVVDRHLGFWNQEPPLVHAFRCGEREDRSLLDRRETLDREIPALTVATACRHFPEFDPVRLTRALEEEMAVITAAFRGAVDFPDWVAFVAETAREKLVSVNSLVCTCVE